MNSAMIGQMILWGMEAFAGGSLVSIDLASRTQCIDFEHLEYFEADLFPKLKMQESEDRTHFQVD